MLALSLGLQRGCVCRRKRYGAGCTVWLALEAGETHAKDEDPERAVKLAHIRRAEALRPRQALLFADELDIHNTT